VLVAVVMLFVVGAMAALSIDVVTFYTARSEAQLVADAAALAAARVLANSGATSDTTGTLGLMALAEPLASAVAIQVAQNSMVGGRYLVAGEVVVNFSGTPPNPHVTVRAQRTDLPTFFARIWGSQQVTVAASATAEAYNPSGAIATAATAAPPVAPLCVKPWLLPNADPYTSGTIFNPTTGAITDASLLGWSSFSTGGVPMNLATSGLTAWQYYVGDPSSFPAPTQALPACAAAWTDPYRLGVAGCVQMPISCNSTVNTYVPGEVLDTEDAVNCLTHATTTGGGDTVTSVNPPSAPFQFVAGDDNPIPGLARSNVMVSDSLVTVPVFDTVSFTAPGSPVTIIGFVQLFLNPDGNAAPANISFPDSVNTTVINMAGCGAKASGTPILGNGASPVTVRLISPP